MLPYLVALVALVAVALAVVARTWSRHPLPPGPKGRFPFLGMTFDMPKGRPWEVLEQWSKQYGSLMHYRVGLQDFIVVSDGNVARELLDKRSGQYSSRPPSEVGDIISGGMRSVLMPYGDRWRRTRRVFNNVLTSKKCDSYLVIQEKESIATLQNIRNDNDSFASEIHRYSLSVARSIAFGKRVPSSSDEFAIKVHSLMDHFSQAMTPGKYLFEAIPLLRRLPRFMQPWLAELEEFRDYENDFSLRNYKDAIDDGEKHPNRPSVAVDLKKEMQGFGAYNELQAATTCMEILGAGSDTTASSLLFVIMAMIAHPECLRKAQEELDRVIGQERFPTWADEPNLPYIRAIIKEQHRWRTIAPMSFAHWSDKEDVYEGYRIPKNAVVRINTWAMQMDPTRFPDPKSFRPERFLSHPLSASAYANQPDVAARDHFSYGGGKRICVGIHLAERSLFTMTSRLIHAFGILPALDQHGNPVKVDVDNIKTGLIMMAEPFEARFIPRSEKMAALLTREWEEKVVPAGESWLD